MLPLKLADKKVSLLSPLLLTESNPNAVHQITTATNTFHVIFRITKT